MAKLIVLAISTISINTNITGDSMVSTNPAGSVNSMVSANSMVSTNPAESINAMESVHSTVSVNPAVMVGPMVAGDDLAFGILQKSPYL